MFYSSKVPRTAKGQDIGFFNNSFSATQLTRVMSTCKSGPLVVGLLIFAVIVSYCTTIIAITANKRSLESATIVVTPDNETLCPSVECYTIDELIYYNRVDKFSNFQWLDIYFLQGRHVISEHISSTIAAFKIARKIYVGLTRFKAPNENKNAETMPVIEYTGPFSFIFEEIHSLNISGIAFQSTNVSPSLRNGQDTDITPQTIEITKCVETTIESVSTTGTGILAEECNGLYILNTRLLHYTSNYDLRMYDIEVSALINFTCGSLSTIKTKVVFQGNVHIKDNIGEAISVEYSEVSFDSNSVTIIANNTYVTGTGDSAIVSFLADSVLHFKENSIVRIENNTASGCGGIKLVESYPIFHKNSTLIFSGNMGEGNGGALALYRRSTFQFVSHSATIKFIENRAGKRGGAIFVDDSGYIENNLPTVPLISCHRQATPALYFINNTAKESGNEIFGGWIDWPFKMSDIISSLNHTIPLLCDTKSVFSRLNDSDLSTVSSNPVRVCMCNNSTPNCNITTYTTTLYPGQSLQLEAVAVGQRYGTVSSTILADYTNSLTSLGSFARGQNIQAVGRYCTPLQYTVMSSNAKETIYLHTENAFAIPNLQTGCDRCVLSEEKLQSILTDSPDFKILFSNFTISVKLLVCPLGFLLIEKRCTCHHTLVTNGLTCNTSDFAVYRPQTKWINATFEHTVNNTDYGILVHDYCPFDYCYNKDTSIKLESPQDQCDFNRSDILCGACRSNFSHVFGTSRCKRCSNLWVLLIVPTVILAGIALVAFLTILDLTVSIGIINGLIFYSNIVRANQAIFFPTKENNTFLNVFIAWLNLDLGVETCFYDGLDAYTITWLQFIFPFYIWLLVTLIIVSSHYSSTVSRWSGSNAVQVLATLFLLSYVKLLRLIITVFLSTVITYPDGYTRRVWLYDGNVDFLKGKHIPLFIAALMTLVVLTVPYTITLITIQWLQRHKSCKRVLFWVHKFKPIFDAHTGPYKSKHRYWTGVLLLFRVALLLIFTINLSGDPSVNLLAITVSILCFSMYFLYIGGPYESKLINLIEISFYFNACILSTTTIYRLKIESNSTAVTTVSTSIAFVIFMIIVFYHAIQRITETRRGATLKHSVKERVMVFVRQSAPTINTITGQQGTTATQSDISHSSIELKEPLLANVEQIKQD